MKKELKDFIDANVHDGQDRSGCVGDTSTFTPDDLQELVDDMYDDVVAPRIKALEDRIRKVSKIAHNVLYWDSAPEEYKETLAEIFGWQEELKTIKEEEQ
jgi:hypothetical protein